VVSSVNSPAHDAENNRSRAHYWLPWIHATQA
jgi:hypothetical protein